MKLLELQIDESIFSEVKSFLNILPKRKIKVREIIDDSHIADVGSEEQRDIEEILRNRHCHTFSRTKSLKI